MLAHIDEISLTPSPCNPNARVLYRDRAVPPAVEGITLGIAAIKKCQEIVELIGKQISCDRPPITSGGPEVKHDRAPRPTVRPPVEPHRATSFGQLVSAIERNHHVGS
jgi:hypothetical protein